MKVNDVVRINEWKRGLRVKSVSEDGKWIIATTPSFGKSLYSIINTKTMEAGTDDRVFSHHDYMTKEDCDSAIDELVNGKLNIGRRNRCDIKVLYVNGVKQNDN